MRWSKTLALVIFFGRVFSLPMNRTALPLHFDACLIVTWLVFLPKYALDHFSFKKVDFKQYQGDLTYCNLHSDAL